MTLLRLRIPRRLLTLFLHPVSEKLALLLRRRRRFFDCVVLPQLDSSGQEIRFLVYADEWHIILRMNLARKRCEHQRLRRDNYNPYIAALLIAVAQAHDDQEAPYITVGFTPSISRSCSSAHGYDRRLFYIRQIRQIPRECTSRISTSTPPGSHALCSTFLGDLRVSSQRTNPLGSLMFQYLRSH